MVIEYRGFRIRYSKHSRNLLEVGVSAVGGTIPDYLGSLYTTVPEAKSAIDRYLTPKPKREVKDASKEKVKV